MWADSVMGKWHRCRSDCHSLLPSKQSPGSVYQDRCWWEDQVLADSWCIQNSGVWPLCHGSWSACSFWMWFRQCLFQKREKASMEDSQRGTRKVWKPQPTWWKQQHFWCHRLRCWKTGLCDVLKFNSQSLKWHKWTEIQTLLSKATWQWESPTIKKCFGRAHKASQLSGTHLEKCSHSKTNTSQTWKPWLDEVGRKACTCLQLKTRHSKRSYRVCHMRMQKIKVFHRLM